MQLQVSPVKMKSILKVTFDKRAQLPTGLTCDIKASSYLRDLRIVGKSGCRGVGQLTGTKRGDNYLAGYYVHVP